MSDKFFIDTNIFIYCFHDASSKKSKIANKLVADALDSQLGIISFQVIQEFLNVALKKFRPSMSVFDAENYLAAILNPLCKIPPSLEIYRSALLTRENLKISFYDSLIISSALESGCSVLYSEDLQDGREYRGLKITNPFSSL